MLQYRLLHRDTRGRARFQEYRHRDPGRNGQWTRLVGVPAPIRSMKHRRLPEQPAARVDFLPRLLRRPAGRGRRATSIARWGTTADAVARQTATPGMR